MFCFGLLPNYYQFLCRLSHRCVAHHRGRSCTRPMSRVDLLPFSRAHWAGSRNIPSLSLSRNDCLSYSQNKRLKPLPWDTVDKYEKTVGTPSVLHAQLDKSPDLAVGMTPGCEVDPGYETYGLSPHCLQSSGQGHFREVPAHGSSVLQGPNRDFLAHCSQSQNVSDRPKSTQRSVLNGFSFPLCPLGRKHHEVTGAGKARVLGVLLAHSGCSGERLLSTVGKSRVCCGE